MAMLTMRPYAGEADLQPIVDLLHACEAVDQLGEHPSFGELGMELSLPSVDQARDLRLWEDDDGRLIGFGRLYLSEPDGTQEGRLWLYVHPEARGAGLEPQIIGWAEERVREAGRESGKPAHLRASARTDKTDRIALLEAHGFVADRHSLTMTRALDMPIPEPSFPEGFTLRCMAIKQDAEDWTAMFNESFIDHWNFSPLTVTDLEHMCTDPNYRSEMDLIVIAPDGTFAAFCYCQIEPEERAADGSGVGWIIGLGTRRGFRRIGLGRAMLLAGLHKLKGGGVATARLGVDAASPTGAVSLYESAGFETLYTRIQYRKDLP